jgi:hypothetical protein
MKASTLKYLASDELEGRGEGQIMEKFDYY